MRKFLIGALVATAIGAVPMLGGDHFVGGITPAGTCGGDLGGTFPNCTVDVPVTSAAKVDGANGDLLTVATSTCATGFFWDVDGNGSRTAATEPCANSELVQVTGETGFRYDASQECYYIDFDADGSHDFSANEQCIDGTAGDSGGVPHDGRLNWCSPIAYEEDGSTTTDGIQECVDYLEALGGGTVLLGPRAYNIIGASPITTDSAAGEIRFQGAGVGATFINCTTANGCTASTVVYTSVNYTTYRDFSIQADRDATSVDGITLGCTAGYPSQNRLERLAIDGDSGDSAGSRQGVGVRMCGVRSMADQVDVRFFADGFKLEGTASGESNQNVLNKVRCTSCDDGVETDVGGWTANTGSVGGQFQVSYSSFETLNGAAVRLRGGSSDTENRNSLIFIGNYVESVDAGVAIVGSSSAYDPYVISIGNKYATTTTDAITADSSTNSNIYSQGDRLNATNCITHSGTGKVTLSNVTQTASPCVPTGLLVDTESMVPFAVTKATASATAITNTTTETAFSTCAYTVPANSVAIGSTFRITAGGTMSGDAATPGNIAFRARWGSVNTDPLLLDLNQIGTLKLSLTSDGWVVDGLITIRTIGGTGTAVGTGSAVVPAVTGLSETMWDNQASTTTIDTTAATALTLFADWGTQDTDNTITAETCLIERVQ